MTHDTTLLMVIEHFEDCKIPLFNYTGKTDFEDIGLLKHYLRRMAHECDWMQKVIINALSRLDVPELQDEFKALLDKVNKAKLVADVLEGQNE